LHTQPTSKTKLPLSKQTNKVIKDHPNKNLSSHKKTNKRVIHRHIEMRESDTLSDPSKKIFRIPKAS
jgi:hypothetical protein